ncbi:83c4cfc2-617d-49fc-8476-a7e94146864c [Thermothielavioides terrestris]|uniref:mRNA N(6)-methyladenine demethylase n=1 Tax=Thermothielavioides terrestris TaxID=2587410 RepID=A0A446BLC2_9PEZI|nr:83c4cfc2-617d-49fc-8476-a7e94146864c [Thermothielavioides terrestris]
MTLNIKHLDAHEPPSDELRAKWKAFSRAEPNDLLNSGDIDDVLKPESAAEFCRAGAIPVDTLNRSFRHICPTDAPEFQATKDAPIYYHPLLPANGPASDTSFFSYPPTSPVTFTPKDPSVHKPLSIKQALERKLHWVTLGGQYDWTRRVYPEEGTGPGSQAPPAFPPDVAAFLETLFPETLAQAAIVNFYTPGDTMMLHRDVSEETDKGLVSLSLGCDGLFMIAPNGSEGAGEEAGQGVQGAGEGKERKKEFLLLRLRSGDAIYMTKESRVAWHGVPKVLKGTCPDYLADWPAEDGRYEEWRGWMRNKRINLNVRQMRD